MWGWYQHLVSERSKDKAFDVVMWEMPVVYYLITCDSCLVDSSIPGDVVTITGIVKAVNSDESKPSALWLAKGSLRPISRRLSSS